MPLTGTEPETGRGLVVRVHNEAAGVRRIAAQHRHLVVACRSGPGDVTYRLDGRVVTRHIRVGGVFFLPAGRACEVTLHKAVRSFHLLFDHALLREGGCVIAGPDALAPILGDDDVVLQSLLAALEEALCVDGVTHSPLVADLAIVAIAARLGRLNQRQAAASSGAERACALSPHHVRKVQAFVEANLADDIRLRCLAALCGLSAGHFARAFKAMMGISPYQYVVGARVGRAKTLLAGTLMPIAEVARCCGFANEQHLSSVFRRLTGTAPGRYRSR